MLAVAGSEIHTNPGAVAVVDVPVAGVPVRFALIEREDPQFDASATENQNRAWIRTRAFSLNFRDKAIILRMSKHVSPTQYFPIGSELAGDVLECGPAVTRVQPEQRVVIDGWYPQRRLGQGVTAPGLPTNRTSIGLAAYPDGKLAVVPPTMSYAEGAAFTIGAQTSYSMVRRIAVGSGDSVLVTAARSNTSLFAIRALAKTGARVFALTTSGRDHDRIQAMGAQVIQVDAEADSFAGNPEVRAAIPPSGFDAVIDPFVDLYLGRLIELVGFGGRYTSCGIFDQYTALTGERFKYRGRSPGMVFQLMLLKNITYIGNCLGETADLHHAIDDHAAGRLQVPIDSVFGGEDIAAFIDRTYNDPQRFGKVVFEHS